MNLIESVRIAINALWVNKMRALLTMLGIIIGIASVIVVVALGHGSEVAFNKEFQSFGVSRAVLYHNNREDDITERERMTVQDIELLENAFSERIDALSIVYSTGGTVVDLTQKNKKTSVSLMGVDGDYNRIQTIKMTGGRYFNDNDVSAGRAIAVVDADLVRDLFGHTDVIGEMIRVDSGSQTMSLKIAGVFEPEQSSLQASMGFSPPKVLYVPITAMERLFNPTQKISQVEFNITDKNDAEALADDVKNFLKRRHNTDKNIYDVYTAKKEMETINNMLGILTGVIGAIAAISLVVGGIGVMNIMLVSVTERTREIGIRKALGARRRDILTQFLVESVIIAGVGGMIGTALGIGLSMVASLVVKVPPSTDLQTILIACGFSAGVGMFFGIYPANQAAKLDPIEALRYE